ncbi:MAG: iron complex outermembrane receptor protein [Lysobacterales bacterium]|jgi:iron complex outermembrane receptor protein
MNKKIWPLFVACSFTGLIASANVFAQDDQEDGAAGTLEEIVVTGSRIRKDPLNEPAPIMNLSEGDLDASGLTNLGAILQQLPISGSAINTRFNVPGNSGFPQDGNGIGAGATQVSLRNLGAKRTLVLVDGRRWIAGASASGVPGSVDLNTIPANVIERVEILQDGASAIYGSDAIGGVINIITRQSYDGFRIDAQSGSYLSEGDGESRDVSLLWGGGDERTEFVFSASFSEEEEIQTANRAQSAFPSAFGTDCLAGGCSTFTPQGRFVLGPNFDFWDGTLNTGVLNDGTGSLPVFDPTNPNAGDFHGFTSADRFNFNGPGFNFLQTPNQRTALYANVVHNFNDTTRFVFRSAYIHRESQTRGAPEPFCLGEGCGNQLVENIVISALNPFNPFGVELSQANGNLNFYARRPLESGPRIFDQDVDTYQITAALEGEFGKERTYYWDIFGTYGENQGTQVKQGAHNGANLQVAVGDPAVCAAVPGCVPFNLFGGQGPNGTGSITPEMLAYVGAIQHDSSEQTLLNTGGNITGSFVDLPAGPLGFAAGFEFRQHNGSYSPDVLASSGNTLGIPAGATKGDFDVTEYYFEVNVPLLADAPGAEYLELNAAVRSSDYSTFGSEGTYKFGVLWQPTDSLSVRGSISTGIRAPGIGELFGGSAREDFTFVDPCSDLLGVVGSAGNGHDAPQPANIVQNCGTLGVPADFLQRNPQLSAVSAGNSALGTEESDNVSFGFVYNTSFDQSWIEALTVSVDFYDVEIENAIQGGSPGDVINACVNTLDPVACAAVQRGSAGAINLVNNQLQNIGGIEASGVDLALNYLGPDSDRGQFNVRFDATFLSDYTEITNNSDGSQIINDRTGTLTNETFARAFPEWRSTTRIGWMRNNMSAGLAFRWVDSVLQTSGNTLDSRLFTDLHFSYNFSEDDEGFALTVGANNILDEDPAVCDSCGSTNMSSVLHDIPGTVGYVKLTYRQK